MAKSMATKCERCGLECPSMKALAKHKQEEHSKKAPGSGHPSPEGQGGQDGHQGKAGERQAWRREGGEGQATPDTGVLTHDGEVDPRGDTEQYGGGGHSRVQGVRPGDQTGHAQGDGPGDTGD